MDLADYGFVNLTFCTYGAFGCNTYGVV